MNINLICGITLLVYLEKPADWNTSCKNVNDSRLGLVFFTTQKPRENNLLMTNLHLIDVPDSFLQINLFSEKFLSAYLEPVDKYP